MILFDKLRPYTLYLASQSPRRKQILQEAGFVFSLLSTDEVEEKYPSGLSPVDVAVFLSSLKTTVLPVLQRNELVITADTIVVCDGDIMGKPASLDEAALFLHRLSDHTHQVITGVTLTASSRQCSFHAISEVHFAPLTEEEIDYYLQHYAPLDKAGAYGIQEFIGMIGITHINGSFYNVMGLPVSLLYHEMEKFINDILA